MKKEELYEKLEDIDEKFIDEARKAPQKRKQSSWIKWASLAACFCLIFAGAFALRNGTLLKGPEGISQTPTSPLNEHHEAFATPTLKPVYNTPIPTPTFNPEYALPTAAPKEIEIQDALPEFNTEEYNSIRENGFVKVATMPLSTFAADVDTGSYTNLRRMILKDGYKLEQIPSGAVRIEEIINYFDYAVTNKSDGAFSVQTETGIAPWNEEHGLLMMTIEANRTDVENNGNNFVFLIDTSGSMYSDDKLPLAVEGFKLLTDSLSKKDVVSIVSYAGSSKVVLEGVSGCEKEKIYSALDNLKASGGTNGSGGIEGAYKCAEEHFIDGGNNRVILASDGDMNLGETSQSGLVDLISSKRDKGIFLTTLGFGTGNYSDANMESIADAGNGNYYYIDCVSEAERVLVDNLKKTTVTVAKDVKFQVEFNPVKVAEYRLIGYENRAMEADDFADDTKDGGEVGAGQQVTVLYELVYADAEKPATSNLKYQGNRELAVAADTNEILTLSIRYKDPEADTGKEEEYAVTMSEGETSDDFKFASSVVEACLVINHSQYSGIGSIEHAMELVKESMGDDEYRQEFYQLLENLY